MNDMKREEFIERVKHLVSLYIENDNLFDQSPQLRVNPVALEMTIVNGGDIASDIADSEEIVEAAAGSDRPADEDADDFQVAQNPDFYPVKELITTIDGKRQPAKRAIAQIAGNYASAIE